MNKFLNHRVRAEKQGVEEKKSTIYKQEVDFLNMCASCWDALDEARRKMRRSLMYSYGDQWGDFVRDPDTGRVMTEGDLIKKNGKVPLKNNMIAPILSNIDGQLRQQLTRPVCVARDQSESTVGEMMSIAIEYVHDINDVEEVDSDSMRMLLNGGMVAQRIEFGMNPAKDRCDVWLYGVNPARLFFNTNLEDVRQWDLTCIGELFDMPLADVLAHFAHTPEEKEYISNIYANPSPFYHDGNLGMQGEESRNLSFYSASRNDLCRVILGWHLETREAYCWNDTLRGTWGYVDYNAAEKRKFDEENERRRLRAKEMNVASEDVLLVEYVYATERYWYYRYMTPYGDVLQEGRTPYWHGEHNYVLHLYPLIQGKLGNFVEQFIDQQRAINRTATLIDFIRGTSSKGVLVVDDEAFESMSREEVIDEYVRYNGVLFVRLKPGQSIDGVVRQYNSGASVAGDFELLNLQLRLINEISGVNSAMQGQAPKAGTPASLYAQQAYNSSLNLRGLFDAFRTFRRRRDTKLMQTIQQFYNEQRHIELAGKDYSAEAKIYNPEKVQNVELDLAVADGYNTPAYQMLANDFLMELFRSRAVDIKTVLENCSFPFAQKILEAVKRNEQQLQQGDRMEGISPEMIQQLQQQMSAADVSESAVPGSEAEQSVAETEQPVTWSETTDV